MTYIKVPSKITIGIRNFCNQISSAEPIYVQIVPVNGAIPNECFSNVDKKIANSGGEKVLGWSIWEWKGVFYEAELHAVWKSPKNALLDVSLPSEPKERKRMFLSDPNASFQDRRVNNIRKSLRSESIVQEFFNAFDEKNAFIEKYSEPGQFGEVKVPAKKFTAINDKIVKLELGLLSLPKINPNDLCFCGSGKKYKHCCL